MDEYSLSTSEPIMLSTPQHPLLTTDNYMTNGPSSQPGPEEKPTLRTGHSRRAYDAHWRWVQSQDDRVGDHLYASHTAEGGRSTVHVTYSRGCAINCTCHIHQMGRSPVRVTYSRGWAITCVFHIQQKVGDYLYMSHTSDGAITCTCNIQQMVATGTVLYNGGGGKVLQPNNPSPQGLRVERCERPREMVSDRSWDAEVEVGLFMGMLKSPRIRVGSSEDMKCGSQAEKWSRKRALKYVQLADMLKEQVAHSRRTSNISLEFETGQDVDKGRFIRRCQSQSEGLNTRYIA
ncbi:unnamed protein product [Ranitomeya imitator]|uniref:Uncharacterized protein n=1 Tax=Ranitomeya imitator TaxID=111125 RepID=A0ABN9LYS9_9NEOB|nr:unnamed protein product [Ranitomeya imitator]